MRNSYKSARILGLAAVLLGLLPSIGRAEEPAISEAARKQFKIGVALLQDPGGERWEEAYLAFKAAYAASPSPKILGNLGLCAMTLERDGEAIDAYSRYLKDVPSLSKQERAQIAQDLDVLKGSAAPLALTVEPEDAAVTDERVPVMGARVVNRYTPTDGKLSIRIRAGHHVITVHKAGLRDETLELDVSGATPITKNIVLHAGASSEPETGGKVARPSSAGGAEAAGAEPERPVPASVWAMMATTGALAIAAGVVGGLAASNHSSYEDAIAARDAEGADSLASKGQVLNITTDVLIGTAAASAVVTLVLYLTRPEEGPAAAPGTASLRVVPVVGPSRVGLGLYAGF